MHRAIRSFTCQVRWDRLGIDGEISGGSTPSSSLVEIIMWLYTHISAVVWYVLKTAWLRVMRKTLWLVIVSD